MSIYVLIAYFFLILNNFPLSRCPKIYSSPTEGFHGCFHVLTTVNKVDKIIHVRFLYGKKFSIPLSKYQELKSHLHTHNIGDNSAILSSGCFIILHVTWSMMLHEVCDLFCKVHKVTRVSKLIACFYTQCLVVSASIVKKTCFCSVVSLMYLTIFHQYHMLDYCSCRGSHEVG
jgi:hypothetical protein